MALYLPMPAAMRTACSDSNMSTAGAPYGPSMKTSICFQSETLFTESCALSSVNLRSENAVVVYVSETCCIERNCEP